MKSFNVSRLAVAATTVGLVLSLAIPAEALSRTRVAAERSGPREEQSFLTAGITDNEDFDGAPLPSGQTHVVFKVSSRRNVNVTSLGVTVICYPEGDFGAARSELKLTTKTKVFKPDEGAELPARVRVKIPASDSENCHIAGSVSRYEDERGRLKLKLLTENRS